MSNDGIGECSLASTTLSSGDIGTSEKCPQSDLQCTQLLPGIPDMITLDQICTKLPWMALYALSSVSPAWRQAVRSHLVYNARVFTHSTDTVVVHNHYHGESTAYQAVALYSTRDKRCFELPGIPGVERGLPWASECVSLDGKIYVLGGAKEYDIEEEFEWATRSMVLRMQEEEEQKEVSKEVYVLDLAGQRQWQQIESMQEARHRFACGIMNGKIYVFGGAGTVGPVHGSEVYDPKLKTWSSIKAMPSLRCGGHRVATVGEELCVYGGGYYDDAAAKQARKNEYSNHEWIGYDFIENSLSLEVYNPVKDEWRVVENFLARFQISRTIFGAGGKLHWMSPRGILAHFRENNAWKLVHRNSFAAIGPPRSTTVVPCAMAAVDDVLYAGVGWYPVANRRKGGMCLLEGRGFGSTNKPIAWKILSTCSCDFEDIMHTMQL
ncbi:unnamed protein product [Calypogeia fissa]